MDHDHQDETDHLQTNGHSVDTGSSICVSIEPNLESEIYEIKYDGQEVYKEPLSFSDNLAQLISKIDFSALDEKKVEDQQPAQKPDKPVIVEAITARKFYHNIQEKVRLAYDEVCVLLDCLTLARQNKLLGTETRDYFNTQDGEEVPPDVSDKTMNFLLKKKNIEKVREIFKKSVDKIMADTEHNNIKFHLELYRARQIWRIRKVGLRFTCDLSYRSVGCLNSIKANLELIKNDSVVDSTSSRKQYLKVVIPDDLKDYAYIQVRLLKRSKKTSLFDSKFSLFTYNGGWLHQNNSNQSVDSSSWQELLEREQNSIYCKEIYNQLQREAFDPNSSLKAIVIGNSIQIMVDKEHDLIIGLVHTQEKSSTLENTVPADYNFDNALLEYYLHNLLKKSFDQNFFHYDQRPVTSVLSGNTQVKIAGMVYYNLSSGAATATPTDEEDSVISVPHQLSHLLNRKKKINLLQSIKEKAEHLILRKRILRILSLVSKRVGEPCVFVQQAAWNSATSSDITVTISSSFYETVSKSFFQILIKQANVSIIGRSGAMSTCFTDRIDELYDYFLNQCCFHQTNLISTLSQLYGWKIYGNSINNDKHMTGTVLIYNDKFSKKIGIKVGPVNRIQLFVNQYNDDTGVNSSEQKIDSTLKSMLGEMVSVWLVAKNRFVSVDLNKYPGMTVMQKFELFLADYATPEPVVQL